MKLKRSKEARKALTFYRTSFGLTPPYRVLVDGPMAAVSLHRSIYLKESIASLLDTPAPLLVTSACVRREVVALAAAAASNQAATPDGGHDRAGAGAGAPDLSAAALFLKRVQTVKCTHAGGASVPASECILSLVGGGDAARASGGVSTAAGGGGGGGGAPPSPPPFFLVATNDGELIRTLRARPGVPVIRLVNQTALRVETPSAASAADAAAREGAKDALSPAERSALTAIVCDGGGGGGGGHGRRRRRRREPNPLSVKKRKRVVGRAGGGGGGGGVPEGGVAKKKRRHGSRKAKPAEPA